jgi:hypothetical protein
MSRRTFCPFCGSDNVDFEDSDSSDDDLIRDTYSCECGLSFVEVFAFSHVEDEDGDVVEATE